MSFGVRLKNSSGQTTFDTTTIANRVIYVYTFTGANASANQWNRHLSSSNSNDDDYHYYDEDEATGTPFYIDLSPRVDSGESTWTANVGGSGGGGWIIIPKPSASNHLYPPLVKPINNNTQLRLIRQSASAKRSPFNLVIFSWE